jgi:very-short-patch-repair endonuclease
VNNWNAIRTFYAELRDEAEAQRNEWAYGDAYLWDHAGGITLTPIERWLWADIRAVDAVLYPQYPVGGFFVDFGNPAAKVAIECDGAEFHKDKAKDAARDAKLAAMGWTVYRITGRDCRTQYDEETRTPGAALPFVREIAERHRIIRGKK